MYIYVYIHTYICVYIYIHVYIYIYMQSCVDAMLCRCKVVPHALDCVDVSSSCPITAVGNVLLYARDF